MRQLTRNQVPITKQRTFSFTIPPIDVQRRLVPAMDTLNSELETFCDTSTTKLTALEELKKSILQKAFAGDLT